MSGKIVRCLKKYGLNLPRCKREYSLGYRKELVDKERDCAARGSCVVATSVRLRSVPPLPLLWQRRRGTVSSRCHVMMSGRGLRSEKACMHREARYTMIGGDAMLTCTSANVYMYSRV